MTTPPIGTAMYQAARRLAGWVGVVERVIDGDTVRVRVDLWFKVWHVVDIRLLDVSAPEVRGAEKVEGMAAQAYLATLLPPGRVVLVSGTDKRSFNRYVGTLTLLDDDTTINARMEAYVRKA